MPIAPATPSLRGVSIVKTYGDGTARRAALRECTIDLYPGQLALLMGPSGPGKSTLLAILSGLLEPDSGHVLADDEGHLRDVWEMSQYEREAYRLKYSGFVFQGYNLFPALTARQQLEIVLKWGGAAGRGDARRRADEMLDKLGLQPNKHKSSREALGRREAARGHRPVASSEPELHLRGQPTRPRLGERAEGD